MDGAAAVVARATGRPCPFLDGARRLLLVGVVLVGVARRVGGDSELGVT